MLGDQKAVIDAPPLPTIPTGKPVAVFYLRGLPSYNDILYRTRKETTSLIREERLRGRTQAALLLQARRLPVEVKTERGSNYLRAKSPVFTRPLFCFVSVWRQAGVKDTSRGSRRRDVYNLCLKAFIDGCTDAGLWIDDSEEYHQDYWVHYAGVAPEERIEVSLYEL